ncbi:type II secretion system protein [Vogesella sp. LIG4]|uniref:type II secretion system protein n=1 Tax=Vogesella sp. LIG4 TaxID=1192162 RepID=UPI00081F899B|nr:type II secretion system protein [Vogesella sp. LIG4]SCK24587.1 general secretion pathway protein G [Vogesella sp. LIG4]
MIFPPCSAPARHRHRLQRLGFTLIELVMTLALVGIVALTVLPFSELMVQRQKEQQLSQALREIRTALDAYKDASDNGFIEKEVGESGYPPTLTVLADGVKNAKDPDGKLMMFLRRVPRDPFFAGDPGTPPEDTWNKRAYGDPVDTGDTSSETQDAKDVFDVSSKSDFVGINGIPYKQW